MALDRVLGICYAEGMMSETEYNRLLWDLHRILDRIGQAPSMRGQPTLTLWPVQKDANLPTDRPAMACIQDDGSIYILERYVRQEIPHYWFWHAVMIHEAAHLIGPPRKAKKKSRPGMKWEIHGQNWKDAYSQILSEITGEGLDTGLTIHKMDRQAAATLKRHFERD